MIEPPLMDAWTAYKELKRITHALGNVAEITDAFGYEELNNARLDEQMKAVYQAIFALGSALQAASKTTMREWAK